MEARRRFRPSVKVLVLGLVLCLAIIGGSTAVFAAGGPRVHPHITVTPHTIYTDINGCGSVRVSGTGYSPSTQAIPNFAALELSDSEGGAFFQGDGDTLSIPLDARGRFSSSVTICDSFLVPGDTFTICTTDEDAFVDGNCVDVRAS